ncbi:hypothetical protein J4E85_002685 [Alternaria conjuncta]|uniref:uncharacterized protein n=1 Tax=Alternaria conjuncta TaxID=181017 RepID=UPI00221E6557|nr:uncharacterized protein J4E85_002685 [Alternaria conjuncta]KAI4934825.1 hypothetical protein J4E85_002685 [Alternaria conjuncta]
MFQFTSLVTNPFASKPKPPQRPPSPPTMSEDTTTTSATPNPFPFLRLPLELREQIYSIYFTPADHLVRSEELEAKGFYGGVYQWDFNLWLANKQIYAEAKTVWRRENVFVKIATPWPSAVNHISSEGLVPIVCTDARADAFNDFHAVVQITAPFHGEVPEHMVVMLVDDLPLFTKTWYYSALSYPMLNERLSTTFVLRDPYGENGEAVIGQEQQDHNIPLPLQRKLLLPFEHVKGLSSTHIHGYSPVVREELASLQAIPIPTLRESVENATDHMLAGDVLLASATPSPINTLTADEKHTAAQQALDLYNKAFHSIHILISGRTRRVLADDFFHEAITTGRYAGQTGITIRVVLRLKLVSRTIAAYNALGQYAEAAFWGFRSIKILQESLNPDFEHFLTEFLEGSDVGWIYVRAGLAFWQMERDREAWMGEWIGYAEEPLAGSERLWQEARRYVKSAAREGVRKELQGYGVPGVYLMFGDFKSREEAESMVADDGSSTSEE